MNIVFPPITAGGGGVYCFSEVSDLALIEGPALIGGGFPMLKTLRLFLSELSSDPALIRGWRLLEGGAY